jgi:hypothetical protein
MDRSAEATVTVTAKPAKPKVGEEVSLTAVLSHIPAGMKYYEMSMGFTWSNEPKRSMAKSVRPKDDRILNTGELTWDAPGTYTVTATYYNGTKAFVKGTLELTVE